MKNENILDAIGMINDDVIREAKAYKRSNMLSLHKRLVASVAAIVICFTLAVPALAATVPAFYEVLYSISPATAQFFKPVQKSCEDNGIRMEVVAAHINEDTAEIYVSMQGSEETRIDETIDLFDSYNINTPFDCSSHCEFASYDPITQTATFLITIEHWNEQKIEGKKLTFNVRNLLSNKQKFEGVIADIDLANTDLTTMTQIVSPRGIENAELVEQYKSNNHGLTALKSDESITSPIDGVMITAVGYVNGTLHVQVYYENILNTDNHGTISLKNPVTGEIVPCSGSFSFFDAEKTGSYQDYVFADISTTELLNYQLYGEFVTSDGSIEGDWSVTFPLENKPIP